MGEPLPEHRIEPQSIIPITQDHVRGLFTHTQGCRATITFDKQFPNIVHVRAANGHEFDANFSVGLDKFIQNCDDQGVKLDRDAAVAVPPMQLEQPTVSVPTQRQNADDDAETGGGDPVETSAPKAATKKVAAPRAKAEG